jgi:hypothetical protein
MEKGEGGKRREEGGRDTARYLKQEPQRLHLAVHDLALLNNNALGGDVGVQGELAVLWPPLVERGQFFFVVGHQFFWFFEA